MFQTLLLLSQYCLFSVLVPSSIAFGIQILCDERILGAMLIHGRCTQSGPLQLLRDKVNTSGMSESLKAAFLRYKQFLTEKVNSKNLNLLTYTYAQCPILFISGTLSAHRSGVRYMFELMNKARKDDPKSRTSLELMEIDDTATPLIEKPEKVAESALLFLQGLGIVTSVRPISGSTTRKSSIDPSAPMASPEKRSCSEFVNLDSASPATTDVTKPLPTDVPPKPGDTPVHQGSNASSRFLNRQLSMAELDLPRGPDALSTLKIIQSAASNSSRKFSQSSAMEHRLSDTAE
ncbi:unnamed protein product [Echinostoma caproni]|uniref:Protein transport protein SEC23 n=1 Tax=Echinostoma caproni TaxID=27848 RepID=A0A183AKD6_9TREM|nr:unnamed protein product [Echinostoma caproni]